MVSTRRTLMHTTAVLAALLVASGSAADVTPAPTPSPSTAPPSGAPSTPLPSASVSSGKPASLHAVAACTTATLAVVDQTIAVSCSGQPKGAVEVGKFTTLEIAVESSELVIESLGTVPIESLYVPRRMHVCVSGYGKLRRIRFDRRGRSRSRLGTRLPLRADRSTAGHRVLQTTRASRPSCASTRVSQRSRASRHCT